MRALTRKIVMLFADRKAATAVEYGLILALLVLALMTGLSALGSGTSSLWGDVHAKVVNAR